MLLHDAVAEYSTWIEWEGEKWSEECLAEIQNMRDLEARMDTLETEKDKVFATLDPKDPDADIGGWFEYERLDGELRRCNIAYTHAEHAYSKIWEHDKEVLNVLIEHGEISPLAGLTLN